MDPVADQLHFKYHILKRMFTIMPRKRKNISMLYIDYINTPDNKDYVEIKYRFRNAIWFKAEDTKTIANKLIIPKTEGKNEINLTVHGYFRHNIYKLLLMPDYIHVEKITSV
jgi:hypothetical protein